MILHEKIKTEVKQAMLARDETRLSVVRGLLAAFTNELVTLKRKPDETLDDEMALTVIRREAKKRQEAISQFAAGGRTDLAESEKKELAQLQTYLPPMMNIEEITKLVVAKKTELGVSAKADAGRLIGALMKELEGRADGAAVKAAVEELLK